jgi:hypothetical protein
MNVALWLSVFGRCAVLTEMAMFFGITGSR